MYRQLRCAAIVSTGAAMLIGIAGINAGIAQAAVDSPATSPVLISRQADFPPLSDSLVLSTTKTGSDDLSATCTPADQENSAPNSDPGSANPGSADPNFVPSSSAQLVSMPSADDDNCGKESKHGKHKHSKHGKKSENGDTVSMEPSQASG